MNDDAFDEIVAGFYRAAAGTIGWVDALIPFQHAVSAVAIHLHAVDASQGRIAFSHVASDLAPEAELDYVRTYHQIDPRANLVIGGPPGQWVNCWEVFDEAFVAQDRFYQEFLIPYGGRYVSGVKLIQDQSTSVILGVHRGSGVPHLDEQEIRFCQRLGRHLADAMVAHRTNIQLRHDGRLGTELLTRLRSPVLLIDEQRRLHHANPMARALLASRSALYEDDERLFCKRPSDDGELLLCLRRLLRPSSPASPDALFLRATTCAGDTGLGLYLYALRPQETLHVFGNRPMAMVLLHDPDAQLEMDPFVVASAFALTPAEARVAVATTRGESPEQIARRHAVSIHTVRSQLRSVQQKTGTTRLAELVSLVASLPAAAFHSPSLRQH